MIDDFICLKWLGVVIALARLELCASKRIIPTNVEVQTPFLRACEKCTRCRAGELPRGIRLRKRAPVSVDSARRILCWRQLAQPDDKKPWTIPIDAGQRHDPMKPGRLCCVPMQRRQSKVVNRRLTIFSQEVPVLFGIRKKGNPMSGHQQRGNHGPQIRRDAARASIAIGRLCCYETNVHDSARAFFRAVNITCPQIPAERSRDPSHHVAAPEPHSLCQPTGTNITAASGVSNAKAAGNGEVIGKRNSRPAQPRP